MSPVFFGWNPWNLYGGVSPLGWNPWTFAAGGTPTASVVRAIAKGQETVQPQAGSTKAYAADGFDDPAAYARWAVDVRLSMIVVEFLGKVSLDFDHNASRATVNAVVSGTSKAIVSLVAPSAAEIDSGADGLASTRNRHPADSADIDALVAQNEGIDEFMLRCAGAVPGRDGAKYELARAVSIVVNLICLRMKHAFAVKRPGELDPSIVPMLPVPGHASFPGGHANMASALALVLGAKVKGASYAALKALAAQIALNRVKAGLHYQLDSNAGHQLGEALGAYLVATLVQDETAAPGAATLPLLGVLWKKASEE